MKQKCRVCSSNGPAKKVVAKYYQLDCINCGSTSFYFEQSYEYGNDEKYSDSSYLDNYELRWAHEVIATYLLHVDYKVRCLEIGCFNGQFVNELRSNGIDSFGTDINLDAINYGVNKYFPNSDKVLSSDMSILMPNVNTIILIDVLEHMEDPSGFIKSLPKNITKLIVSSPLANKILFDKSDFPPHHYSRIDPYGLIKELNKVGFTSIDELHVQSSFLLLIRNFFGRLKYGWNRKWYEGSPVFAIKSQWLRKFYKIVEKNTSPFFKLLGLRYSAFVLIINR
jgi:hypothetical protein